MPSQSAHVPYSRVSSTRHSPTSKTTAPDHTTNTTTRRVADISDVWYISEFRARRRSSGAGNDPCLYRTEHVPPLHHVVELQHQRVAARCWKLNVRNGSGERDHA